MKQVLFVLKPKADYAFAPVVPRPPDYAAIRQRLVMWDDESAKPHNRDLSALYALIVDAQRLRETFPQDNRLQHAIDTWLADPTPGNLGALLALPAHVRTLVDEVDPQ